jgi:dTDP-glucose 4,6-dehydratase
MKTVIVTGGLGFIGSNLINILNSKDYFIINIDKLSYASNLKNINSNIKNYKFYKEDINNKNFVKNILNKYNPSIIYNLAAETHVDRSIDGPTNFINSNILGVFNILESIKNHKNKIKLIQISTDEVYGDIKKNYKSKENDAYNPSSPYAASKASGDLLIKSYIRTYKLNAIITNCCNNYGPNQYPEKLIPTIIYSLLKNQPIPIYGNGKNIREWIHVLDSCKAIEKLIKNFKINQVYNIGSNLSISNIQIVKKIAKIMKKKIKVKYVSDRPSHDVRYSLNSIKFKKEFKWKPEFSLNEGIVHTIKWYQNNSVWIKESFKKYKGQRLGKI